LMGRYEIAASYDDSARLLINDDQKYPIELATIFLNKAFIYNIKKSYDLAIEYLEKSIRIYKNSNILSNNSLQNLSAAYLNIGIVYYELKNYTSADEYFIKSANLKTRHNLTGLGLVYLNLAKTLSKTGDNKKAEEYYLKSISTFIDKFDINYYRLADIYFDYGIFLRSQGRAEDAMEIHRKALDICLKNYGTKHTFTSLAYKHIADDFLKKGKCDSALVYYQKSLISIVRNFNDTSIYSNPSIDSSIFDIRLLDNLKSKAKALDLLARDADRKDLKLKAVRESVSTMDLALELIDRVRNNYPTEESRIYLAENEKETYFYAVQLSNALYEITGDESDIERMYSIVQKSKAAVLRNEITQNDLFYASAIPDSLRDRHNSLSANISAYTYLVQKEELKKDPDNKKIALWKDALFEMNRELERSEEYINSIYPQYHELIERTVPVTAGQVMDHLGKSETVVDYLLSNTFAGGKRPMYIFVITKNSVSFKEEMLDSLFSYNTSILRNWDYENASQESADTIFRRRTGALSYMYHKLVEPVRSQLNGNRLIIIPDEEIAWLPFDAFLLKKPDIGSADYEGLEYMINNYAISYRYVSSLILKKPVKISRKENVYAFYPDYKDANDPENKLEELKGAGVEINAVVNLFRGKKFTGQSATINNFKKVMQERSILHLAMHSLSDSANSKYSFLMFSPDSATNNERLYNYEISLSRIKSPMVVLSACNSGTGTLYHGEGLMSLARGFILAGASSVVKTSWEVNDETSARIISGFYYYLAKGISKDEALRKAKLDYIKNSPPVYKDPYYWAAYEIMGDNSPVIHNSTKYIILGGLIVILAAFAAVFVNYLRRRNNFSERSL
jgi:CHAT domain-containing protein